MAFPFAVIAAAAGCALLAAGAVSAVRKSQKPEKDVKAERKTLTPEERYQKFTDSLSKRQPVKTVDEQLAELGLTRETVEEMRTDGNRRNYRDGKYHRDPNAKPGSVDNPEVVGMPECSNDLRFSLEKKHWILTDGLGNGWIR